MLSDLSKPVYWEDFEPAHVEVKRFYEEMLKLSRCLAEERKQFKAHC